MSNKNDPHDLQRFLDAQEEAIDRVKKELRSGRKHSHWMWFIFPQIEGLGNSRKSQHYAISSRTEAEAYLSHPILGPRLRECTEIVNEIEDRSASEIFGYPDRLKFHSSMTLFAECAENPVPFEEALDRFYNGEPDQKTIQFFESK